MIKPDQEKLSKLNDRMSYIYIELPFEREGETRFCSNGICSGFWDKLNFCALQYMCICENNTQSFADKSYKPRYEFQHCWDMLKKVCDENFKLHIGLAKGVYNFEFGYIDVLPHMYIDHASSAEEGKRLEMFENEQALYDFLSYESSYIKCTYNG